MCEPESGRPIGSSRRWPHVGHSFDRPHPCDRARSIASHKTGRWRYLRNRDFCCCAPLLQTRSRLPPQSLTNQSLGAELVRGPRLHPSSSQELLKFGVTAALEQARQADGCSDYMLEGLVIGPGAPHHSDHSVCICVDQVRISGDLTPAIFERSQIFDAVVLHRLEQSLEPLASGSVVLHFGLCACCYNIGTAEAAELRGDETPHEDP